MVRVVLYPILLPKSVDELRVLNKIKGMQVFRDYGLGIHTGEIQMDIYASHLSEKPEDGYFPLVRGKDVSRYSVNLNSDRIGAKWFDNYSEFTRGGNANGDRIVILRRCNPQQKRRLKAGLVKAAPSNLVFCENGVNFIPEFAGDYNLLYIIGLLNSSLLNWVFKLLSSNVQINAYQLYNLPARLINFSDAEDAARHDRMVALVEEMLGLHKRLSAAKSDSDKTRLERAIKTADAPNTSPVAAQFLRRRREHLAATYNILG